MELEIVGGDDVAARLDEALAQVRNSASKAVQFTADECVVQSKHGAPWHDRTGNARKSIHKESLNKGMTALIGIGMYYGKYLELSHGGKYRIIHPTVFNYGKIELLKNLRSIL
jgi:hypothetical protein|nr:MAG TPA: type I neck protein [Caudoviricetes sp.]